MLCFYSTLFGLVLAFVSCGQCLLVDDFRNSGTSDWQEISDALVHSGQSVSSFVSHSFEGGQSAVLFTLLVPCERNASFAGILRQLSLDISDKSNIVLNIRGKGNFTGYEFVIRHADDFGDSTPSYVTFFKAPRGELFEQIALPIDYFQAYKQGLFVSDAIPLNKKNITSVGILAYGGLHRPEKQIGVAALEIEWIQIY